MRPRTAVPAYFHPAWAGRDWALLCAGSTADLVVINPDSGIGATPDAGYQDVCAALRTAGVTAAGYVDTGYRARAEADVLAEALAYRAVYGMDTVFLDQVTAGPAGLAHYARLCATLDVLGLHPILNPGTVPLPEYLDLADAVVTFEGTWRSYVGHTPVPAVRRRRAKVWHLVHSTPPLRHDQVLAHAHDRGADLVYVTDAGMPNPWDRLPTGWHSPRPVSVDR